MSSNICQMFQMEGWALYPPETKHTHKKTLNRPTGKEIIKSNERISPKQTKLRKKSCKKFSELIANTSYGQPMLFRDPATTVDELEARRGQRADSGRDGPPATGLLSRGRRERESWPGFQKLQLSEQFCLQVENPEQNTRGSGNSRGGSIRFIHID